LRIAAEEEYLKLEAEKEEAERIRKIAEEQEAKRLEEEKLAAEV
jgi:hypothetical protein